MSASELEQQLLLDAQEAGFTVINGLIYSPSACDRLEALKAFAIIRENRAIEPLVRDLNKIKTEVSKIIGDW